MNLFWGTTDIPDLHFRLLSVGITTIPLLFALFYPNVGKILGVAASLSGFLMIYVVPVVAYHKMLRIEITSPLLAAAITENEFRIVNPNDNKRKLPKTID